MDTVNLEKIISVENLLLAWKEFIIILMKNLFMIHIHVD